MRSSITTLALTPASDIQLVRDARRGMESAFEQLVSRYHAKLLNAILRHVACRMTADDIVQDAWIKAYQNLHQLRADGNFFFWLYRIAMNSRRAYYGAAKHLARSEWMDPQLAELCLPASLQPEAMAELSEDRQRVRHALQKLEEAHRRILILRDYEQQDYREISQTLRIKVGTVRSRLHRARSQLRFYLTSITP
ncbi:RNA polymerase sigma factor [Aporhodopirellula aestuarii]|uniref:Sigma-70 family RNA polymerase sigma factor n=1 Tax=Aporhodopirellula aestuarii TaxID=2950107 RepID=A0ABT0TWI0_9BACT|nr:sigma-70 family RNA polymerase sigma factor [Aporhodopirellula aestuarii]MCM2369000.1 sigma-70 family RNA polymerase sigma factor [Aporhodopirellula aestuarii]